MFFLEVRAADWERVVETATQKDVSSAQLLARLALVKGLALIQQTDPETLITELEGMTALLAREETFMSLQEYVNVHWQDQSDEEMGKALGYSATYMRVIRNRMGFKHPSRKASELSQLGTQEREQLEGLIRIHWETKGDLDIGRLLQPPASRSAVCRVRLELGLNRVPGRRGRTRINDLIVPDEFERMVTREGYTMTEFIKAKDLQCTRQRLEQIVSERGLSHSPSDRTPEWFLIRRARTLQKPQLADREQFAALLAKANSMAQLAATLKIPVRDVLFFVQGHRLTHASLQKQESSVVELTCSNPACGKVFVRLVNQVKKREKKAGDQRIFHYCSQKCVREYSRKKTRSK